MTAALDCALNYARRGWFVFPLRPRSKKPPKDFKWREKSSNSEQHIRAWAQGLPGCNFGLDCGKSGLAILDVDSGKHPEATDSLMALDMENGLPNTFRVATPSGGLHIYYQGSIQNSVQKLGAGLDTRGEGGYVVIPGSVVREDGVNGHYEVVNPIPVAQAPEWLPRVVGAPKPKSEIENPIPVGDTDLAHNVASFVAWLADAEPVEENRNITAMHMAMRARDHGLSVEMAVSLLSQLWYPKIVDTNGFPISEMVATIRSSYRSAQGSFGNATAEAMFPDDAPEETLPEHPKPKAPMSRPASSVCVHDIKRREWVLGTRCIAGFCDVLIAPGGMSKSTFLLTEAMAIVTGQELTGDTVHKQGPVWFINGEDPDDELDRRLVAVAKHHGIPMSDLADLHVTSGYGKDVAFLADNGKGLQINRKRIEDTISHIKDNGFVRVIFDPLVRFHRANENDNMAMDKLMQTMSEIAARTGASVSLAHHTNKPKAADERNGDANTARGASSVISAARIAHTMGGLGPKEAKKMGITDTLRKWFVRVDDAKANLAPPADKARWFKRVSVQIESGDNIGALEVADLSMIGECDSEEMSLAQAVYDVMISCGESEMSVYELSKTIASAPGQFPEVCGEERTLRRRISDLFEEPIEVCGTPISLVERRGKTGKKTEIIVLG